MLDLLRAAVRARRNLLVTGGTGSGKTTTLAALAAFVPARERVVTIEDAAELRIPLPHVVRLESRPPSLEGAGAVPIRALVRNALRMRPDRIVVGEVRGGEALDMLTAMTTGHEGSLSTLHASSPGDAIRRVQTLALMGDLDLPYRAVADQVASALDVVVHQARLADGRRRVVEIAAVAASAEGPVLDDARALGRGPSAGGRSRGARPPSAWRAALEADAAAGGVSAHERRGAGRRCRRALGRARRRGGIVRLATSRRRAVPARAPRRPGPIGRRPAGRRLAARLDAGRASRIGPDAFVALAAAAAALAAASWRYAALRLPLAAPAAAAAVGGGRGGARALGRPAPPGARRGAAARGRPAARRGARGRALAAAGAHARGAGRSRAGPRRARPRRWPSSSSGTPPGGRARGSRRAGAGPRPADHGHGDPRAAAHRREPRARARGPVRTGSRSGRSSRVSCAARRRRRA